VPVIPAQAGMQRPCRLSHEEPWIPACAGTTARKFGMIGR